MNIIIGENLRELRKKKNNTQEDLAEFLTVSITSVSKWERGECYPDIEFLPRLASYYDVSVDDLLGVGEIKKQERIKEYGEKSSRFHNIGDINSDLALWREAKKEFPNDWTVLRNLMDALSSISIRSHSGENSQEIIEIGEKILAQCTDNDYRYSTMQTLCFLYDTLGDKEKAKEYANMAPNMYVTSNLLLSHVLKGDEFLDHCQHNIVTLTELLCQEICWYRSGINDDDAKYAYNTALKVYELIYEDGDFGFYACRTSEIYNKLSRIAAERQNKTETLDYLANAVKYAIIYDTQDDFKHTSPLVNRLSHSGKGTSKNYMSNTSYLLLKDLEDNRYDFCRGDELFAKLLEDLKSTAKENASA